MKYINRHLAVVTGILIALAGTAVPAGAAFQSISSCGTTISTRGDYALTANLTCATGDAIIITASNVSLKLNGFIISGGAANNGINVNPPSGRVNHVAIQGPGIIRGFVGTSESGIAISNADYSQVALVTLTGNYWGLLANNVNYLTANSNVIGRSTQTGLVVFNSTYGEFAQNDLSGNGSSGISTTGGSANTINNNTANGNVYGIFIGVATRVYGNVTNGNAFDGILLTTLGSGSQIFSNTSSAANGNYDLEDQSPSCSGDLWGNNVFGTRSATCIN